VGELDDIVAQLEPVLGALEGEPQPLAGGITNRNFRARFGGSDYMIRRHGKDTGLLGIDREAERMASEAAARLEIAPEVVAALPDGLVARFVSCRQASAEEIAGRVSEIALALRSFHDSGLQLPVRFWVPDLLSDYARIAAERGAALPRAYATAVAVGSRIAEAMPLSLPQPCHDDLLPGNIIRAHDGGRIMIVDWEYAGMGHPYFDLGNLSINNGFDEATDDSLLSAYHGGGAPSDVQRARLKLMRLLSDAREGAWAVVQSGISELDFDFEAYGEEHFGRLLAAAGDPELEEWLATA
jgi:thiamine kinase-like enzyme